MHYGANFSSQGVCCFYNCWTCLLWLLFCNLSINWISISFRQQVRWYESSAFCSLAYICLGKTQVSEGNHVCFRYYLWMLRLDWPTALSWLRMSWELVYDLVQAKYEKISMSLPWVLFLSEHWNYPLQVTHCCRDKKLYFLEFCHGTRSRVHRYMDQGKLSDTLCTSIVQ